VEEDATVRNKACVPEEGSDKSEQKGSDDSGEESSDGSGEESSCGSEDNPDGPGDDLSDGSGEDMSDGWEEESWMMVPDGLRAEESLIREAIELDRLNGPWYLRDEWP
jgi:hypothetical protein